MGDTFLQNYGWNAVGTRMEVVLELVYFGGDHFGVYVEGRKCRLRTMVHEGEIERVGLIGVVTERFAKGVREEVGYDLRIGRRDILEL